MDSAGIIHRVLENKESLLNLHSVDGEPFDLTYINDIFKTIQLAMRIWLQKDEGINHSLQIWYHDLVPFSLDTGLIGTLPLLGSRCCIKKMIWKSPISEGRVVLKVENDVMTLVWKVQ